MTEYEAARGLNKWAGDVAHSGEGGAYEHARSPRRTWRSSCASLRGGIDLGQTETIPLSELGIGEDVVAQTIGQRAAREVGRRAHELGAVPRDCARSRARREGERSGSADDTLVADAARVPEIRRPRGEADRPGDPPQGRPHPARPRDEAERARRLRPHDPRGVRRARARQDRDVRRDRGALARLHRRRVARDARGDRGGADPRRRHRGAEEGVAPADRGGRGAPHGGLHRAESTDRTSRTSSRGPREEGGAWQVRGQKTWITHACAPT